LAAVAAGLGGLALTDQLTPPLLLTGAGVLAAVAALDNPVRQVYLPGVVARERRARVVGLNALSYNLGAVVGPAAAGILIPVVGVGPCFVLNAASYLLVWGGLLGGPPGRPPAGSAGRGPPVAGHSGRPQPLEVVRATDPATARGGCRYCASRATKRLWDLRGAVRARRSPSSRGCPRRR